MLPLRWEPPLQPTYLTRDSVDDPIVSAFVEMNNRKDSHGSEKLTIRILIVSDDDFVDVRTNA